MNSIMERWVQEFRHELLDRTLIWNQRHLLRALGEFEDHHNRHRPHQAMDQAVPLRPVPEPATELGGTARLDVRRHDRLGESSTSTDGSPDLRGRSFRQAQGKDTGPGVGDDLHRAGGVERVLGAWRDAGQSGPAVVGLFSDHEICRWWRMIFSVSVRMSGGRSGGRAPGPPARGLRLASHHHAYRCWLIRTIVDILDVSSCLGSR